MRVGHKVHEIKAKDTLYKYIFEVLPTRDRLYILRKTDNSFCLASAVRKHPVEGTLCPSGRRQDLEIVIGGDVGNVLHLLTECKQTRSLWG